MATSRISFIPHALEQLRDRGISLRDVRAVILDPHRVTIQSKIRTRAVRQVMYQGKPYALVVAYDRRNGMIEVVTGFRSSKVEKYV